MNRHDGRTGLGITASGGVAKASVLCRVSMLQAWKTIASQLQLQPNKSWLRVSAAAFELAAGRQHFGTDRSDNVENSSVCYAAVKRSAAPWYRELCEAWLCEMGHPPHENVGSQ